MGKDVISIQLHSSNSRIIECAISIDWEVLVLVESILKSTETCCEVIGSIWIFNKLCSWVVQISDF